MRSKTHKKFYIGIIYKRLAVFACFFCVILELQASTTLFLWPIDHSCARAVNSSNEYNSSLLIYSRQQSDIDDAVQRNLFDATTEDDFTRARARSMGIDYDDIARCFEYALDTSNASQPTINMGSLEPCRSGLHFERLPRTPSIIERFDLTCSRQWLKVLVPQSTVLGLLLGHILFYVYWYSDSNILKWTAVNLSYWASIQLLTIELSSEYRNPQNPNIHGYIRHGHYYLFLTCVLLRSIIISSILCRIMTVWQAKVATSEDGHSRRAEDLNSRQGYIYLVMFALILIASKIFLMPLVVKFSSDWLQLNRFLTHNQLFGILLTCLVELVHEPRRLHLLVAALTRKTRDVLSASADETVSSRLEIVTSRQEADVSLTDELSPATRDLGDSPISTLGIAGADGARSHSRRPYDRGLGVEVCEFCLVKEDAFFRPETDRHHRNSYLASIVESLANNDESLASTEPNLAHGTTQDPYRPTTVPIDYDDSDHQLALVQVTRLDQNLFTDSSNGRGRGKEDGIMRESEERRDLSSVELSTAKSSAGASQGSKEMRGGRTRRAVNLKIRSSSSQRRQQHARHNTSLLEINLARWPLMGALSGLLFCLAFSYFLMQTMPNHKLMHVETIASLAERKTNHRRANQQHVTATTTIQFNLKDSLAAGPSAAYETTDRNSSSMSHQRANLSSFDFRSIDYATGTLGKLANSLNPLELCWITTSLNGWPIELFVILLYLLRCTNFASNYLKPHRLFLLVQYGAKVLLVEWLLIGLMPKQDHQLLDFDWLLACASIIARLTTSLMLYSHLHMLLRLSAKISCDKLTEAKQLIPVALVALSAALMAPIAERLSLALLPAALVVSSLATHYLAGSLDERFKALLCPMMFEDDADA